MLAPTASDTPVPSATAPATYGPVSRVNHWVIALAMIGMLAFGLYLEFGGLAREAKGSLIGIHKAIGVSVLGYGLWRVGWRLRQGFPPPASAMPSWQERMSKAVHVCLLASSDSRRASSSFEIRHLKGFDPELPTTGA